MEPFQYKGTTIDFEIFDGKVAGMNKRSETRVGSSGGGGYVKDGQGYISSPIIYSSVTTKLDFWIIVQNGGEIPIQLTGFDIPIRNDQEVTAIAGTRKFKNLDNASLWNTGLNDGLLNEKKIIESYWVFLINHNSNQYWQFYSSDKLMDLFSLTRSRSFGWLWGLILGFVGILPIPFAINNNIPQVLLLPALLLACMVYLWFDFIKVTKERQVVSKLLNSHIRNLLSKYVSKI